MSIGDLIKEKRKEAGFTQDELAKRINVTKSTLSKWESGRIDNMRRNNIASLSNALRISPIELLNAPEQKNEKKAVIAIDERDVTDAPAPAASAREELLELAKGFPDEDIDSIIAIMKNIKSMKGL